MSRATSTVSLVMETTSTLERWAHDSRIMSLRSSSVNSGPFPALTATPMINLSTTRVARAMMNLGMALKNRMARPVSTEELDRIVSMIDDTAAAIEKS